MEAVLRPLEILKNGFPHLFLINCRTTLFEQYAEAYKYAQRTSAAKQPELLAQLQHFAGNDALEQVARRFEDGAGPTLKWKNTKRNSHTYAQVDTPAMRITTHRVNKPSDLVRKADYRSNNAVDNHIFLSTGLRNALSAHSEKAYVLLLHGPSELDPSKLGFLRLALPASSGLQYIDTLDLYLADEYTTSIRPAVDDNALQPRLKAKVKVKIE